MIIRRPDMTLIQQFLVPEIYRPLFEIDQHCVYRAREIEVATQRFQECVLRRGSKAVVEVVRRDFSASTCRLEVDLKTHTIRLLSESMESSWASELLEMHFKKIVELLLKERDTEGAHIVTFQMDVNVGSPLMQSASLSL